MAIYIKGVTKPNNCGECQFCHTENFTHWCCPTDREDILYDAIPEWCPLVYIPEPHGRLIDADELGGFVALKEDGENGRIIGYLCTKDRIDRAPTVIEGSE